MIARLTGRTISHKNLNRLSIASNGDRSSPDLRVRPLISIAKKKPPNGGFFDSAYFFDFSKIWSTACLISSSLQSMHRPLAGMALKPLMALV